ncbi:MFS general substrate transporter [Phanerochaete sordida]|uniref:MFS general substrate transporter n=1 Tax=Phanerochaete sordida TaxID=48140 RepID=A0A9P3GKZ1_9APHY|nr:MFS general substrate transporter [Phanerochaete sordida]
MSSRDSSPAPIDGGYYSSRDEERTVSSAHEAPAAAEKFADQDPEKQTSDSVVSASPAPPQVPDGGLTAWLVVLASTLATFNTFGFINAWGVFQEYYQQTLLHDRSSSTIAWIGSLQYALIFMTGLPLGRLFDKGWVKVPVTCATATLVTGTFLVAQCTHYWHFLLCQGFFIGISCGFIMMPAVSVIPQWFRRRKGVAYSFVGIGSSLGGVIYPIVARKLISEVGFQWTMRIIGFMQLALLIPTCLFMARNFPPKENLPPLSLVHYRNPAFSFYCAAGFVAYLGLFTVLTYIDVAARAAGQPDEFSFYLVAIANAGSTVGRLVGGVAADKLGPFNTITTGTFIAGIMTYAWPYATGAGALVIVALIYGAASGVFVGIFATPLAEMGDIQDFGQRMGLFLTTMSFGAVAGPPISGAIAGTNGNFDMVGVYAGSTVMGGVILMLTARYFVLRRLWGRV